MKYKKKNIPKPPKKITEQYLYNSSLYYLQRFTSSSGNLRSIMTRKIIKSCDHHEDQDIDRCKEMLENIIVRLQAEQYINDESYTKAMINSYRNKGLSEKMIKQKLSIKSIPSDLIDDKQIEIDNEISEITNSLELDISPELIAAVKMTRKKRIGCFKPESKDIERNKELSILARNGYSFDIANKALNIDLDIAERIVVIRG